jgi:hypothetical protein
MAMVLIVAGWCGVMVEQLANTAAAGGRWTAQKAQDRWALATDKMGE